MRLAILTACVLAAVLGGCFSTPCDGPTCVPTVDAGVGSTWDIEHTFMLRHNGLAEAEFDMPAGSKVTIELSVTPAAVEWDIHSHGADGGPITYMGGRQAETTYDFVAPKDATYWALWSNTLSTSDVTITVKIKMSGGAVFSRWY